MILTKHQLMAVINKANNDGHTFTSFIKRYRLLNKINE